MNDRQRTVCCTYQDLDEEFICEHWSSMDMYTQAACYESQRLSIELLVELWGISYNFAKTVYIYYHVDYFKAKITLEHLPQFLTDSNSTVRRLARECIEEK